MGFEIIGLSKYNIISYVMYTNSNKYTKNDFDLHLVGSFTNMFITYIDKH